VTTVVIDVGCAKYGGDESIPYLIEEFEPDVLLGFDPQAEPAAYELDGCSVVTTPSAVWTDDGHVTFEPAGTSGRVVTGGRLRHAGVVVPCVSITSIVREALEHGDRVIVKMDAEGAEYELLPALIANGLDAKLELVWVEWHCEACRRGSGDGTGHRDDCPDREGGYRRRADLIMRLACEVHPWNR